MNEALLIASAIVDIGLVILACYRGRTWVFGTIVLNLLLISTLGAKIVEVFGFSTNVGNVYYAAVFLAMYLLLEYDTKARALRATWMGAASLVFFTILVQLALGMESVPETAAVSDAMKTVLGGAQRFALASVLGFVAAQLINIGLYVPSGDESTLGAWPVRLLVIIMVAQLVDSVIFFTIAFWGTLPTGTVVESMLVGYFIKVIICAACMPLILLCRNFRQFN